MPSITIRVPAEYSQRLLDNAANLPSEQQVLAGIQDPEDALARCDEDIIQNVEQIQALKARRSIISDLLSRSPQLLSGQLSPPELPSDTDTSLYEPPPPIHRLSNEILRCLFLTAISSWSELALIISHTCSRWHHLSRALPLMWTHIHLTPSMTNPILDIYLNRSDSLSLIVHVDFPNGVPENNTTLHSLYFESERWKTAHIRLPRTAVEYLNVCMGHVICLQELTVEFIGTTDVPVHCTAFSKAPRLRRLTLGEGMDPDARASITLPWRRLDTVELLESLHCLPLKVLPFSILLNLKHLIVGCTPPEEDPVDENPEPLRMYTLQTLTVKVWTPHVAASVGSLILLELRKLVIDLRGQMFVEDFAPAVQRLISESRVGNTLKSLTLAGDFRQEEVQLVLGACPRLEKLELVERDDGTELITGRLLKALDMAREVFLPHLTHITFVWNIWADTWVKPLANQMVRSRAVRRPLGKDEMSALLRTAVLNHGGKYVTIRQ